MATLVLTAAGTALGGPIGGLIGAAVGQRIDGALFGPKGREGARIEDLAVQTSAYGTPIARVFGTMRVAGTVVWSTDLIEDRNREGGGKGRPATTSYSYSASFAVALSGRPILGVGRIWADGKLLRGEAGDWKSETGFRLHLGGEDQAVDPLIASAEAAGAPAYRGIALAVFEDMQLADFGNRIPSLTFEVEADAGEVPLARIVEELSEGAASAQSAATLGGYAASGESARGAIEALLAALPHQVCDDGEALVLREAAPGAVPLDADELGAGPADTSGARRAIERGAAGACPDEIAMRYHEPLRDYQAGLQRARLDGPGRRIETVDLPAAISAERAKAIAEARLDRRWAARTNATARLPWRRLGLRPGDAVTLPGVTGDWRIAGVNLEVMALGLELVRMGGGAATVADVADPGRATGDPDLVHGPTTLHLLDLPALDHALTATPQLMVAAAGEEDGWRRAALLLSLDGGASHESIGQTAPPAVVGSSVTALAAGAAPVFDDRFAVEIELLNDAMWLEGRDDNALVGGANLALLGDEILQFGGAEPLGDRRFILTRLLRGRRGTEWAAADHAIGERFVLLEQATLRTIEIATGALGGSAEVLASGIGDEAPAEASATIAGRAIRPPSPAHLTAARLASGDIEIGWTRRSRLGWAWNDGGDAPLGEENERYALTIAPSTGAARAVETIAPAYLYTAAQQAADGSAGAASIALTVAQLGALAASDPPATRTIPL